METPVWQAPAETRAVTYTSTDTVRALAVGHDGTVWAATDGGVVCWGANREPYLRVWTTADGLVSNDVRTLTVRRDGTVVAASPSGVSELAPGGSVTAHAASEQQPTGTPLVARTAFGALTATMAGVSWAPAGGRRQEALPFPAASRASHVSALAAVDIRKREFMVGLYGDGLYRLRLPGADGKAQWLRVPEERYRFVTALAVDPTGTLVIGTRHDGLFTRSPDGRGEYPVHISRSLSSGDVYGIAPYNGRLFVSTFDRGVVSLDGFGMLARHPEVPQGRTLVPFGGYLYALQADHSVGKFDGEHWEPAWGKFALRRADVYSLALDRVGRRLLVGGFGGWAEWDGQTWRQHWSTPGLEGESITAICADGSGAVWVGTQRRGLFRCIGDSATPFQEAQGLTDDWITSIAVSPKGRLLVGTYTGGLLEREGDRFVPRLSVEKWAMRRVVFDGETALVATPVGLYREGGSNRWEKVEPRLTGGPEIQALLPTEGGVWVGTRNGLAFTPY